MVAIKILSVGSVREIGEKKTRLVDCEVLQLDTKDTYKVSVFLGKNDPTDIKVSADYEANVEAKEFKGKKQYSTTLWTMKEMPKIKEEVEEEAAPNQEMWAAKEKRDFKGRCLMYAIETMKAVFPGKTFDSEGDYIGMAEMIASQYLDYIYIDDDKTNVPF